MLERYGEETWFRLGDRDLATHIVRTARLRRGDRPTEIARDLQRALGVHARDPADVRPAGPHRGPAPTTAGSSSRTTSCAATRSRRSATCGSPGSTRRRATPEVEAALEHAEAIVIAPSNPFVSVRPILAVAGIEAGLQTARSRGAPVVAVSGIVGGAALKGPADRMLVSLGHEASALGVARQYTGIADVFVLDRLDAALEPRDPGARAADAS